MNNYLCWSPNPRLINEHSSGAFGQGFSKPINRSTGVEHSNRDQQAFHNGQLGLVNTAIDGKIADHSYLKQSGFSSSVIVSSRSSDSAVMHLNHSSQLSVQCFLSIYNQKTSRQSVESSSGAQSALFAS